jgi:hypothetical protein
VPVGTIVRQWYARCTGAFSGIVYCGDDQVLSEDYLNRVFAHFYSPNGAVPVANSFGGICDAVIASGIISALVIVTVGSYDGVVNFEVELPFDARMVESGLRKVYLK